MTAEGAQLAGCRLCGTPLGAAREAEFCCAGCARVFAVLAGLDAPAGEVYLRAARRLGIVPDGAAPAPATADGPRGGAARASTASDDALPDDAVREERFRVGGVVCPSCTWVIERVLEAQPGVRAARFDFLAGTGTVRYDLRHTSADRLAGTIAPLGYRLVAVEDEAALRLGQAMTFRFVAAAVITMNLMSLSVLRYAREIGLLEALPAFLPWLELALCLPVMWLGFGPIARRALAGLAARVVTMDAQIALSSGAAFLLSVAALLAGRHDIYFETAAGLLTVSLLGRMIEARLRERALRDTARLMRLEAARVRVLAPDGAERYRPVRDIEPGTCVRVCAGETVPFDGEVAGDTVLVNEAVLTGEPEPRRRVRGDFVFAGAVLVEGTLALSVVRPYGETRISRIAETLRGALGEREGRLRSTDAVAAVFAPAVVLVAVAAWLARLALHGWAYALGAEGWFPSVAVLAVACPCAFSLAGVAAITAATSSLLGRGLLTKRAAQLEGLHRIRTVVFDKTGTVTEGGLAVEGVAWSDGAHEDLLAHVLAAEAGARHPVAHALRLYLGQRGVAAAAVDGATIEDRVGVGRRLHHGDRTFSVGASSLFRAPFVPAGAAPSHTLVWFGHGEEAAGCFLISDRVRPSAAAAVQRLRQDGLRVELLSGDREEACREVARQIGADAYRGDVDLEQKVELVRARVERGEGILYVGDGTNDALAMSAASASIAVAGSTDEALAAAGQVMLHADLAALPDLMALGRRLRRVIRGNLLWAFAFNGLFVPVAALGYLTPLASMLLMLLSSSAVLANSLRLRGGGAARPRPSP